MNSLTFWKIMAVVYGVLAVVAIALSHWAAYLAGKASMLAVLLCFALPALATVPAQHEPPRDTVDVIELNQFYDECGRLIFVQRIFREWDGHDHEVVAWRLTKDEYDVRPNVAELRQQWRDAEQLKPEQERLPFMPQLAHRQYPVRHNGGWLLLFHDGDILREVWARSIRHTATQYDPELAARTSLAKEHRRGLAKPRAVRP